MTPMLELARRDWMIVSDSDRPAVEQRRLYDGKGPWYLYTELLPGIPALTGEDFIKPEAVKSATTRIASENAGLTELTLQDLASGRPKIEVLRTWLQNGLSTEQVKPSLESIKEQIFTKLKASHIENTYFELLKGLAAVLKP